MGVSKVTWPTFLNSGTPQWRWVKRLENTKHWARDVQSNATAVVRKPLGLFAPLQIPTSVHDNLFRHTECNALGRCTFHRTYFLLITNLLMTNCVTFITVTVVLTQLAISLFVVFWQPCAMIIWCHFTCIQ